MFNIKKVLCIFFAVVIVTLFTTGCSKQNQADELILIHSIGIDKIRSKYKITMQIYDTTNAEGEAVASSVGENIKIVTAIGDTIYSALRESEMTEGERFFTGHNMLIVLGESVLKEDIHKALNYFVYDDLTFDGILVATCEGEASDIINVEINDETLSASSMVEIVNKTLHCSRTVNSHLMSIINNLANEKSATVLPVLAVQKENGEKVFKVSSTAVVKNSVYLGKLNHNETIGLNLLTGKAQTVSLCVNIDGEEVVVFLDNIKAKVRPQIIEGNIFINTDISYDIIKREMLSDFNTSYYLSYEKLKSAVDKKVMELCNQCIYKVTKEYKVDVLEIEKYMKFYQNNFWEIAKNDYDKMLSNISYNIDINSQVVD